MCTGVADSLLLAQARGGRGERGGERRGGRPRRAASDPGACRPVASPVNPPSPSPFPHSRSPPPPPLAHSFSSSSGLPAGRHGPGVGPGEERERWRQRRERRRFTLSLLPTPSNQQRRATLPLPNARVTATQGAEAFVGRITCYTDNGRVVGWTAGVGARTTCRATDTFQTIYVPAGSRVTALNSSVIVVGTTPQLAALAFTVESEAGNAVITCGRAPASALTLPVIEGNATVLSSVVVAEGSCTPSGIVATSVKVVGARRDAPAATRFTALDDCPAPVQTLSSAAPPSPQPLAAAPAPAPAAVVTPLAVAAPAPAPAAPIVTPVVTPVVVAPPAPAPSAQPLAQPLAQAPSVAP